MNALLPALTTVSPLVLASANNNLNNVSQQYLENLVALARTAAASLACASILAGQGSEADDLGDDVAVWLGPGRFADPSNVLEALGLDRTSKVHSVPLTSEGLPPTLRVTSPVEALEQWKEEMEKLQHRYCFRTNLGDSVVLFVLVGQLGDSGWAALVGAGVWSSD